MKHALHTTLLLLLCTGTFISCSDDPTGPVDELDIPVAYAFESRFVSGESSVAYGGQTVRNLLVQDLKLAIDALGKPGASSVELDELLALYDHIDAANLSTITPTGQLPALTTSFSAISTGKNLSGKISPAILANHTQSADAQIRAWLDSVARFSNDPARLGTPMAYTTDAGLDLAQLINKVLLGSVVYYQGTSVYLAGLLDRDNSAQKDGTRPYTDMEHAFDEAFGYYGAARNYSQFSDGALAGSVDEYVTDDNGDGRIDFESEYNFGFSRNAGKRDRGSTSGTDMTAEIFHAFRTGRAMIAAKGTRDDITAERLKIARTWEQVVGATVIHYVNEVIADMDGLTAESNPTNSSSLNKHWGELKGFLWALQYNSLGSVSSGDLVRWHGLAGNAPLYVVEGSTASIAQKGRLIDLRDELGSRLGFDASDVAVW